MSRNALVTHIDTDDLCPTCDNDPHATHPTAAEYDAAIVAFASIGVPHLRLVDR